MTKYLEENPALKGGLNSSQLESTKAITVDDIMNIIDSLPLKLMETEKMYHRDLAALKRFFIKKHFPYMTLIQLAKLTGCKDHTTISHSLQKVKSGCFDNIKSIIDEYITLFISR